MFSTSLTMPGMLPQSQQLAWHKSSYMSGWNQLNHVESPIFHHISCFIIFISLCFICFMVKPRTPPGFLPSNPADRGSPDAPNRSGSAEVPSAEVPRRPEAAPAWRCGGNSRALARLNGAAQRRITDKENGGLKTCETPREMADLDLFRGIDYFCWYELKLMYFTGWILSGL